MLTLKNGLRMNIMMKLISKKNKTFLTRKKRVMTQPVSKMMNLATLTAKMTITTDMTNMMTINMNRTRRRAKMHRI